MAGGGGADRSQRPRRGFPGEDTFLSPDCGGGGHTTPRPCKNPCVFFFFIVAQ